MRILIALLLSTVGAFAQVNGTVQNDRTTKHIAQPNGFWLAQPSDSTFLDAVRSAQTNISSGSATGAVISVNGLDGVVVLTTSSIAEGGNQYWTVARSNGVWLAIKPFFQPASANGTNWSLLSTGVVQTAASSVTNNPGSTVNLNATTATLANNLASGVDNDDSAI